MSSDPSESRTEPDLHEALVHMATMAADLWAMDEGLNARTKADHTRGIVETAVMTLIEQGLVVPAENVEERLQQGVSVRRERRDG